VQGALWKRMVAHWLVFAIVAALLATGLEWMSDPFRSAREIASDMWWNYSPLLLAILFLVPVFVFDAIRMSHRFAGPVYRVRQVIRTLAEGSQPNRVEFRDNDFWKDMAGDLNRVIDRLRQQPPPPSTMYGAATESSPLAPST